MNIRRAFAELSVGQIHYAECGDPRAASVLLLHQTPQRFAELVTDFLLVARGGSIDLSEIHDTDIRHREAEGRGDPCSQWIAALRSQ
jgi:hypothetical protein